MANLNNLDEISEIDKKNMLKNIAELADQIEKGWHESQKLIIPSYYLKANKVVILGMGGSGISGALVKSLLQTENEIPIYIHRDYGIPGFVDNKTLVIAISYSGNTEEVLDGFVAAYSVGAKLVAICTGGKLESLAKKYKAPFYKFKYPALPRAAMGYTFAAALGILKKIGIASDITQKEIDEAVNCLKKFSEQWKAEVPTRRNLAKKIANNVFGNIAVIWSGEILETVARRWKTQINENAKNTAFFEVLPELHHNSVSGLDSPKPSNLYVLMLKSKYDHPRVNKRVDISREVLDKKEVSHLVVDITPAGGPLSEMLVYALLGDYVSLYLAVLHDVDPSDNKNIEYIKQRLKE